jgi:hypothetical protein
MLVSINSEYKAGYFIAGAGAISEKRTSKAWLPPVAVAAGAPAVRSIAWPQGLCGPFRFENSY